MRQYLLRIAVVAVLNLVVPTVGARAQSERVPVHGTFENYFIAASGDRVHQSARYLTIEGKLNLGTRFVIGQLEKDGTNMLDENYLEMSAGVNHWRVGRFRSAFGHADWSECYYSGFARTPLLRSLALGAVSGLNRLDTGLDWQSGLGATQYQVGLIDVQSSAFQPIPVRPDHLIARIQTYHNNLIMGFNALLSTDQVKTGATRLFALDWRWTTPHFQTRGEALLGNSGGKAFSGYYLDLFYHPEGLLRTTFLARLEGVASSTQEFTPLYTAGVKHILSRELTLQLSYGFGSEGETSSYMSGRETSHYISGRETSHYISGWSLQLITSTHF